MTKDVLTKKIEKAQESITDAPRDYIGASVIGSDCLRQIWYEFKGEKCEKVPAKTRRTWAVGKKLEELILDWLEMSGIPIDRMWHDLSSSRVLKFRGHVDSVVMKEGKPFAILEVKTAKDSSFRLFVKKGLKRWSPQYYAQIQSYMGMSGIKKAYIIVFNKDTSELSDELVEFDEGFYELLEQKALMISNAVIIPPRVNSSPLWFQCKLCKFNKVCHK